jgi:ketosteroid isomerase-like protein
VSDGERELRALASAREEEQSTERVVGALYDRFLAADLEGMLALFDEDIAFRFLGQVESTGVGAARRFFEFAAGLLEGVRFTIEDTVVDGSRAAVVWSEEATTRDGAPWANHGVDLLEVCKGRIVELHENGDCRMVRRHFPRYG